MRLTDAQRRAVETPSREVLVVSGAGSGKTTVLTERILHLIRSGASPSDFLVLTFTRRAAGEMRERLIRRLAESGEHNPDRTVGGMLMGTFHALALRFLHLDGDRIGLSGRELTVLDPADADMLLEQVCRDLGYLRGTAWRAGLSRSKFIAYREAIYTGRQSDYDRSEHRQPLQRAMAEYRSRMIALNVLDFGSLLQECRRLLTEHPDVLARYRERIKHVVVDELTDTDSVQYDLHDFFAPPGTFFGVGDLRQSIYGWRGARPDLCLKRHPNAEIINLRENFRSGELIVTAANRLIAHNGPSVAEPMIAATGRPGFLSAFNGRSADVIEVVQNLRRVDGFAWRDIAILARNHRALVRLAEACETAGVPHHRVGAGFDVCDTEDFRRLHATMRLCVNPHDDIAFLRLIDAFGLTPTQYAQVRRIAAERGVSHFGALNGLDGRAVTKLEAAIEFGGHTAAAEDRRPASIASEIVPLGHRLAVDETVVDFWLTRCRTMTFVEALDWFATRDAQDDLASGDVVTLSTVHAAKGLEWPCVVIANMNDGEFPSSQSIRNGACESEERNVAYVAVTRARESLVLHYRRTEDQAEDGRIKPPSRFLSEAGIKIPQEVGA